jgi:hypothetical protein
MGSEVVTARFTRRRETFTCLHCERVVKGDGYTNHCPSCLWSRHVDVLPGDRAATCGGPMEPVGVLYGERAVRLAHVCLTCGYVGHNRVSAHDDPDAVRRLLGRPVPDPTQKRAGSR